MVSTTADPPVHYEPPRPGANLSTKLKTKIWKDKFVNFHDLLEKDQPTYALKIKPEKGTSELQLEPSERGKLSHQDWGQAYAIYKACYLSKYDQDEYSKTDLMNVAIDLIKYEMTINKLKKENLDWQYYDENYRKDRQASKYRYSYPRPDLYAEASARSLKLLERRWDHTRPRYLLRSLHYDSHIWMSVEIFICSYN